MSKLAYSKLGLKLNSEINTIKFGNYDIEVKQYLPINDKLNLIANVLNAAADDNNFSNPVKLEVFTSLEMIYFYTNLSFTEKQKEDPAKLYDILFSSGLVGAIIEAIPQSEYDIVVSGVYECSDAVYTYGNSVMGILDTISQDYSNLDLDATQIQQKLSDPDNLSLLKNVLTKMG